MSCFRTQLGRGWRSAAFTFLILTALPAAAQRGRPEAASPAQGEPEVRVSSRPYVPGAPPSDVSLLPVAVAVRDTHGRSVSGLKAADFQVTDQGKEAAIAGVNQITRVKAGADAAQPPRSIGLCFDDYGSSQGQLLRAKSIAIEFVKEGLGPRDLASVSSTFSKRLTEFTSDKQKLIGAIERLEQHATPSIALPTRVQVGQVIPGVANSSGGGTSRTGSPAGVSPAAAGEFISRAFLDLIASYDNDLSHAPGSRAILLLSPGFLGMPDREQDQVISKTVASGVVINVLDSKSSFREIPPASEQANELPASSYNFEASALGIESSMAEFAHSTGGLFFHHDGDPFSHGYHELGDVPDVSYVLALPPDESDAKYRRLRVQLKAPGTNLVEARNGYFPPPKGAAPEPAGDAPALRTKLDVQVVSMTPVTEFPFTVGIQQYSKLPNGKTAITVTLHAALKDLPFGTRNNRHTQKLTLVAAIFDENGVLVSAKEGLMEFALGDAKFITFQTEGVGASLVLEAAPGLYRLCTVGQDQSGKMASTLNKITVP